MNAINVNKINMESGWKNLLKDEFLKPYFLKIKENFVNAKLQGKTIYPPSNLVFNAFNITSLDSVKVVILGQDPYHNKGEAMGLSFSVPNGVRIPPSLKNIYKELSDDVGFKMPNHGDLSAWARQGVLLLNSILSVQAGAAGSHRDFGWQEFTDAVIKLLSAKKDGIIFLLWGNYARAKRDLIISNSVAHDENLNGGAKIFEKMNYRFLENSASCVTIDTNKHFILEAAHPSPLARGAFFGCRHFSKTNFLLQKLGKTPINWQI